MSDEKRTLGGAFRRYLLRGLLIWIPLGAVVLALRILYGIFSSWLFPSFTWQARGLALLAVIAALWASGWMFSHLGVARYLFQVLVDRPLRGIPGVRWVYSGARSLLDALLAPGNALGSVVLVEYPRRGLYSIAFRMSGNLGEVQHRVRRQMADPEGAGDREVIALFVPTTPNPTSGVVITTPRDEVIELDMSREQALQMIISLGVVVPDWKEAVAPESDGKPPDDKT